MILLSSTDKKRLRVLIEGEHMQKIMNKLNTKEGLRTIRFSNLEDALKERNKKGGDINE